jgi:prepilin-type N-terminal cleavage/methylation domain-containing protein
MWYDPPCEVDVFISSLARPNKRTTKTRLSSLACGPKPRFIGRTSNTMLHVNNQATIEASKTCVRPRVRVRRRGLTFIEVVVAASILSIAAMAALELLASTDAVNLAARRQALAAIEAEQALAICAERIRDGDALPEQSAYNSGMQGEALTGCTILVTATTSTVNFTIPPAGPSGDPQVVPLTVRLLTATVLAPNGERIVALERPVPDPDS